MKLIDKTNTPSFKKTLRTDLSIFLAVVVPAAGFIFIAILYLLDKENNGITGFIIMLLYFTGFEFLCVLLGYWWHRVICKLIENHVELEGSIKKTVGADTLLYTFTYEFVYEDKKYAHVATLCKTINTNAMYSKDTIAVYFDSKTKRSLIKEAYI